MDRSLARIELLGLDHTRAVVVTRELSARVGFPLDPRALERDRLALLDLGIFARVLVRAHRDSTTGCPILRIEVAERPTSYALPIAEYDPETELSYGGIYESSNFRGRRESLRAGAVFGGRRSYFFGYGAPWVAGHRLGIGVSLYDSDTPKPTERIREARTGMALELRPGKTRNAGFLLAPLWEEVRTRPRDRNDPDPPPRESDEHRSLLLGAFRDSRSFRLRATQGTMVSVTAARHGGVLRGDVDLWRSTLDLLQVLGTGRESGLTLASRLVYTRGDVPRYLRLNLGGAYTLRGYDHGRYGGESRWIGWVEERFPILAKRTFRWPRSTREIDLTIDGVAFTDAGVIWDGREFEQGHADVRFGGGAGLRAYLPLVGVLRLEAAYGDGFRVHASSGIRL